MIDFNELINDIYETIDENREVTIYNDNIYTHFYEEDNMIISCDEDGIEKERFKSIDELFEKYNFNEKTYKNFIVEMY